MWVVLAIAIHADYVLKAQFKGQLISRLDAAAKTEMAR
jgi:hypothetical protein